MEKGYEESQTLKHYKQAKDYINSGVEDGDESAISSLEKDNNITEIHTNSILYVHTRLEVVKDEETGKEKYSRAVIDWDPTGAIEFGEGETNSPAINLEHEFGHARIVFFFGGGSKHESKDAAFMFVPGSGGVEYPHLNEKMTINATNRIAKNLEGEGQRTSHDGKMYRSEGPDSRKKVE